MRFGMTESSPFAVFITSPEVGDAFIHEVVPRVRELVAQGRGSG